ncbi:MAG: HAD hydrolase family protein, partial [Planctomycetota bacterium]
VPEVDRLLADRGWPFRVSMTWDYINIDLPKIDKASGLGRLFAATGVDPRRSMAIGDTDGDLPMADAVAWFGCPANASAAVKQRADYVSPEKEIAGVLDILTRAANNPS